MGRILPIAIAVLVALLSSARADTIILKNGERLDGVLIGADGNTATIKLASGFMRKVGVTDIERIDKAARTPTKTAEPSRDEPKSDPRLDGLRTSKRRVLYLKEVDEFHVSKAKPCDPSTLKATKESWQALCRGLAADLQDSWNNKARRAEIMDRFDGLLLWERFRVESITQEQNSDGVRAEAKLVLIVGDRAEGGSLYREVAPTAKVGDVLTLPCQATISGLDNSSWFLEGSAMPESLYSGLTLVVLKRDR